MIRANRKIREEIGEQLNISEYNQKVLDDINYVKNIPQYNKIISIKIFRIFLREILIEIKKKLEDQTEIPKSDEDIQEQLCNIRKKVRKQLNNIQRINTENLDSESQQQLEDNQHRMKKLLKTINTAVTPRIDRCRELNQTSNENRDMNLKQNYNAINIKRWMIFSFSPRSFCTKYVLEKFAEELCQEGKTIGMKLADPLLITYFTERYTCVEDFVKKVTKIQPNLQIAIIILPHKGLHDISTAVKTVAETETGLVIQCIKDCDLLNLQCLKEENLI